MKLSTNPSSTSHSRLSALPALTSFVAVVLLSACGGGGSTSGNSSSSASVPVVTTCANGASDFPACTFFTANLQLTVPTPPLAVGSPELEAFNFLNEERAKSGLGKLAFHPSLQKGAQGHTDYMAVNRRLDHEEIAGLPGFVGIGPFQRATVMGYPSANALIGEGLGLANSLRGGVQNLIDVPYHRSGLFRQYWTDVGMGMHCYGECTDKRIYFTINYAYQTPQRNASDFMFSYPRDGQSNVGVYFCGETPWPLANWIKMENACTFLKSPPNLTTFFDTYVGYPILISVAEGRKLTIDQFEIYEAGSNGNSTPLSTWILTSENDPNKKIGAYEAYLIPRVGLKLDTLYAVRFSGKSNDMPVSKNWTFRTDTQQVRFN